MVNLLYSVNIKKIIDQFNLKILSEPIDLEKVQIEHSEVNRPALQLAGYFEYYDAERLQVIGKVEHTYMLTLDPHVREQVIDKMFSYKIPCFVYCRGLEPVQEVFEASIKYNVPILQTDNSTSDFMGEVIRWLKVELAPRITIHGTFVDIYGEGIIIMGDSGIGKSETALELIKRGHRMIADDAVEIRRVSNETLVGTCPDLIRHFLELRGIGIINVREMFGVGSIKQTQNVNLVIKLEAWDDNEVYDRLGLEESYFEILGNKVTCHSIPIRPGRNLAIILESAALNHRQKKMGHNAAIELDERIMSNSKNL